MNTKLVFPVLVALSALFLALNGRALDITATGSGNWSSTAPDAPWPGGVVPNPTNDDVDVEAPYNIIVDSTNVAIQYIYGSGTITMAPGSMLTIVGDNAGAYGTQWLTTLDTGAPSNTVVYLGNAFWAKHQDYCNLVFSHTSTNVYDFYNGDVGVPGDGMVPMTIYGDLTVIGYTKVQQGDDIFVGGNLTIGTNASWDCSSYLLTVTNNTFITGLLIDLDGALGLDSFLGDVTVYKSPAGWNVTDVTQWNVGGNLTNNGLIAAVAASVGYGSITFNGTNKIITGNPFTIPTLTVNGAYTIDTKITLTTNTPTLNGTLVFDLARTIANTNRIILKSYGTNLQTFYYSGYLNVTNTGSAPTNGATYKFFDCTNYGGAFTSTNYPALSGGLYWIDNLLTSGSITVGGSAGSPAITMTRSGALLTLSWDSATYPGYSVLKLTNNAGVITDLTHTWQATGSNASPATFTVSPGGPPMFFRLSHP